MKTNSVIFKKLSWGMILFFLILLTSQITNAQGFLRRDNKKIVDSNGQEILLRGIGIGGWMLQEPYMLNISATNQKDIRKKIENLMGKAYTDTFYYLWHKNFIQKTDIDSIASWGFNSIRVVLHYNLFTLPIQEEPVAGQQTWLDEGFILLDSIISWCKANKIFAILDLHAAPGGQGKDAAISDYDATLPSLWESEENKIKTIALWKKLAERYKEEYYVGAYDLINEPNWDFENSGNQNGCNCVQNKPLLDFYKRLIDTIRKVDNNHLIIVEGNCWGNNYNGMSSLFSYDNNLAVSFHKYWNYNDLAAIQGLINIRNTYNIPIWCGESGENSNLWYTQAIKLLESNNIGWSWWTLKKVGSTSGIMSITPSSKYNVLTNYWKNGGKKPDTIFTKETLLELAEKVKLENCQINYSVLDAMFRQVKTEETRPFSNNIIPGVIFTSQYDYGRNGYAYWDTDTANYRVSTGTYSSWNQGYSFRNDGVDIEPCLDNELTNGYNVGWTVENEWLQFTVQINQSGSYKLCVRHAGNGSKVNLSLNNKDVSGELTLPSSGGWQTWRTDTFYDIILKEGTHTLKLNFLKGGSNFNYLKFIYDQPSSVVPFKIISASSDNTGRKIYVNLNKSLQTSSFNSNDWIIHINNITAEISEITTIDNQQIVILINDKILYGDVIKLTYQGNTYLATDSTILQKITNLSVRNNLPLMFTLPAKIEAENYYQQVGLSSETCSEGGLNMGYTNSGDFLDYLIIVKESKNYNIQFRVAAMYSGGKIELQLFDDNNNKSILGTFDVPATGGWQNWTTISGSVNISKGNYKLRIYIKNPEFNINWFAFYENNIVFENKTTSIKIYPNPCHEQFTLLNLPEMEDIIIVLNDIQGKTYLTKQLNTNDNSNFTIKVSNINNGLYLLSVHSKKGNIFSQKLAIVR